MNHYKGPNSVFCTWYLRKLFLDQRNAFQENDWNFHQQIIEYPKYLVKTSTCLWSSPRSGKTSPCSALCTLLSATLCSVECWVTILAWMCLNAARKESPENMVALQQVTTWDINCPVWIIDWGGSIEHVKLGHFWWNKCCICKYSISPQLYNLTKISHSLLVLPHHLCCILCRL